MILKVELCEFNMISSKYLGNLVLGIVLLTNYFICKNPYAKEDKGCMHTELGEKDYLIIEVKKLPICKVKAEV